MGKPTKIFKDRKEKDLNLLVSGFVDGRLIYLFEFPFQTNSLLQHLRKQLKKRFNGVKDKKNQYLRSANFDFRHYSNSSNLKIIFKLNNSEIKNYEKYINKKMFKFLTETNEVK